MTMAGCASRSTGPATAAAATHAHAARAWPPPRHTPAFGWCPPPFASGRHQAAAALSRRELLGSGAAAAALLPAASALADGGSATMAAAAAADAAAPAVADVPAAAVGSVQLRELRTERDGNGVERLALQSEGEAGARKSMRAVSSATELPPVLAASLPLPSHAGLTAAPWGCPTCCRLEQLDLAGAQRQLAGRRGGALSAWEAAGAIPSRPCMPAASQDAPSPV